MLLLLLDSPFDEEVPKETSKHVTSRVHTWPRWVMVGHARVMLGMDWGSRVPVPVAWVPGVPVFGEHPGLGTRVHVGEHHPEGWVEVSFHSE